MKKIYLLPTLLIAFFCLSASAQNTCNLHASFTNDSLQSPVIHFTNQSTGFTAGDSILWTFGDGSVSHDQNPTHTFSGPGVYHVCLHLTHPQTGSTACTSEFCKSVTVTAPCEIHANYTHRPDSVNPRKVYFSNTSQAPTAATASWSFGDGTAATTWNATHEYANPGRYYVCLTVNSGSCTSTRCDSLTVLATPPPPPPPPPFNCNAVVVSFNDTRDSAMPNRIRFTATASAPILDQVWTITKLPSGSPVTIHSNNPTYTFQDTGLYRVCLHARFNDNCTREVCKTMHIVPMPTVAPNTCMQLYPNPAHDRISALLMMNVPGMIHGYIYNSSNVLVAQKNQQGIVGANTISFTIGTLPSGIYTMKLMWEGHMCSATFFKQ